ncbi:MAG: IPTL-CTERM sorting domain-containing protein [Burkholderiales bacterium]
MTLWCLAAVASAAQLTIFLDTDNNAGTGCTLPVPGGTIAGIEQVLNTTVNASATPPTVGAVTRQVCVNPATNTLGPPLPVDAGGWPVGVGVGQAGYDAIETYIQTVGLPSGTIRLGVAYVDPSIGGDALVTTNGLAGGPPILFALQIAPPTPVPTLGHAGLALLALLLCGAGFYLLRRYPHGVPLVVAIVSIAVSTSLWAIVLDGIVVDWNGVSPIAVDPTGDAPPGADIAAFYAKQEPAQERLYFRADIKTASVPTAVNDAYAGAAGSTLVRPAATGLLANDQLGAPPATLTSFGGGSLGGTVTSNAAGTTVPIAPGGSITVGGDGSFSFTPATGFTGVFQFNYRIGNAIATSDAQVTITINQAPAITSANNATFSIGVPNTFTVTTTGAPPPSITFGACAPALPAGVGFVDNGNGTGTLSGTPPAGSGGTYACTVTASNGIGSPATQPFTLNINQAPTITSASSLTLVAGSAAGLPFTVTATGFPTTIAYTQTGTLPAGVAFNAGAHQLTGAPAAGTGGVYNLVFGASNGVAPAASQNFTLTVNQAPAITSANTVTFALGAPNTFNVTTTGFPAPAITFGACVPALPAGVGFVDNGNGTGTLSGTPPAGSGGTYACTVTASNGVGSPASQPFSLFITQAPVAQDDSYTTVHDTPLNVPVGTGVLANDARGVPPVTGLASVTGNGAACLVFPCAITTAHGGANVNADGSFTYTPAPAYAGPDTFTYTINNGVGTSGATVTITVTNALPVIDLNGAPSGIDFGPVTFTEGGGPLPIVDAAALTVTDADSATLASATVVITNLADAAAEFLSVTCIDAAPGCSGAILAADVVYTPATGTLAIARVAPLADYQALLRTLRYDNTSPTPTATQRNITVTINDGIANNNPVAHSFVDVVAVNTAPVLANIEPAALTYPVSSPPVSITSTLTVTDADSTNLVGATVQLTAGCVPADDVLSFANTASISGTYSAATCLMTLTGSDTPANYQAALRNVQYANNNPATSVTPRTASFRANDGSPSNNLSNIVTRNINVQVNVAPVLANIESAPLAYTEGNPPTLVTSTLTIADADSPTLAAATVQLTSGCAPAEDVLTAATGGGISGSYNPASCLFAFTGSASLGAYQTALRSVRYSNTSNNPSTAARSASFQVDDGAPVNSLSNIVARTINITTTNNAPVVTAGGTASFTEKGPAVVVDGGVTVTDPDSANLASATVQIVGNCVSAEDVLGFVNQAGITGSYAAGTCTLTLTGSATVPTWQTALRSVTYNNTSNNPSTAARTVSWIVNDGALPSAPANSTITVTAVNDAPTIAVSGSLTYTEGQAPASLITSATITDVDNTSIAGATVQITGNYASGEDVLSYTSALGITGSFNPGNGTLTLSGTTTVANYQAALANVKFSNTSNNPSTLLRTVTWQVNDGGAANNLSNTVTSTVTVIAVNNPPVAFSYANLPAQAGIPIAYPAGKLGGTDPEGTAVTINTTPDTLCAGCLLAINADGSFTFTPPPSAAGTTVQFTYHVTDSGTPPPGVNSAPAVVSFVVAGPAIWFVKNPAVGSGNCTLGNECLLGTAVTSIGGATNASIFVGDANTHTAGFTLNAGGSVAGQGMTASFDAFYGIAAPAQGTLAARPATGLTPPSLTAASGDVLVLGTGNTLRGFNLNKPASAGAALTGTNYGTLSLSEVSVSGSGNALNLNNGTGVVTFGFVSSVGGSNQVAITSFGGTMNLGVGSLSGSSGRVFDINGGAGSISYAGTISNNATGLSVANKTGGTVTFSGATKNINTATNTAVNLTSNTGATIAFSNGGLVITTTSGTGFNATGGGTVTVGTGANDNTIGSGTGTALNVVNATIGAGGLTFRSISSNGGSNGIVLDTTGASGGLTVTGDGTNTSVGGNGTGGTIANKSGADGTTAGIGIYLRNTQNVVLRRMIVNGTNTNYGIKGYGVNGFALEYSTVGGTNGTNFNTAPNNAGEGSIYFGDYTPTNGVTGAVSLLNNNVSGGAWSNLVIINSSGTATLTVKGNTFGANGLAPTGNSSMLVEARSGATINTTLGGTLAGEPNTFTSARADLVNFTGQQTSTMDVVMRNNTLSNNHPNNNIGGGSLTLATAGTMTFNVDGNTMRDADGSAVTLFKASALSGTPSQTGRFTNNTIGVAAVANSGSKSGNGIFVSAGGTGTMAYTINNNQIHQIAGNAHIYADNTGGSFTANFTIEGNLLDAPILPGWFAGIAITNGSPASTDTINVCAKIGGAAAQQNTLNLGANLGIIVGSSGAGAGHTFNLPGYAGGASLANVQTFLQGNNTGSFVTNAYADAPATAAAFTGVGATCPTP